MSGRRPRVGLVAAVAACLGLLAASSGRAAVSVAIDVDPTTPGVQASREVAPGGSFSADLVVQTDAGGLSSYAISVRFDTAKLALQGSPAASEALPLGFDSNLTPGVASETEDLGDGTGQVLTFEAVALGDGPVNDDFVAGSIDFVATVPSGGGGFDIEPGFFNAFVDGAFGNNGAAASVVFTGANVVALACGNGVVEGGEQCDDGGTADLDGCSRTCRVENAYVFAGTAQGGSVEFVVDGESVSVVTSSGQSAADVAAAMALAIEANAALAALGVVSQSTYGQVVVAGSIQSVNLADAGFAATVPVAPWFPFVLLALVGATGFAWLSRANARSGGRG